MDLLHSVLLSIDGSVLGLKLASVLPEAVRPAYIALVSILILFIIIISVVLGSSKKSNRKTTLILGLSDSGKTVMYYKLKDGKMRKTYASMRPNEGNFALHDSGDDDTQYHVVDIPGHPRIRDEYRAYIGEVGAIVYVVDASEIAKRDKENAQFLFDVMTNPQVFEHRIPIFVACNKSDLVTAYKKQSVQKRIEKELGNMAATRDAQLSSNLRDEANDDIEDERVQLVMEGEKFRFSKSPVPVDFVEMSMKDGKGLNEIHQFIQQSIE